jgi:hypothetical protein
MESLTLDALRTLAAARGLELTDQELAELLPMVEAARAAMASLRRVARGDREPAVQYRIF